MSIKVNKQYEFYTLRQHRLWLAKEFIKSNLPPVLLGAICAFSILGYRNCERMTMEDYEKTRTIASSKVDLKQLEADVKRLFYAKKTTKKQPKLNLKDLRQRS